MEVVQERSWFSRNWGWVLGGGCLTLIVIVVVIVGALVYKVSDAIAGSEPYTHAFSLATENEKVISFLGEPIETNGMGSTSYKHVNGSSTADLRIPIKGPKDEGVIVVSAEKINNEWSYSTLYVKIDGEMGTINLQELKMEEGLDDF
ncbi:cytochrome c oxidase assembly factor Coa1 family protein [Lacinutrix neustonica]|uniref:Cytochrome c oxidase assembly factor Coa1 family protein n=1 Tax=Lacinutrix neustonica TaxID=2980107 RepID=A0A9E8MUD7_9FLAO|nr:cytochrome c oxidase assembly factor Coa1 family protein [Lacinutrix neustonica]WAC00852.1 cytochrome c oxidase assembly factor Coa1 family protein [Lacinutrix neustonica]